MPSMIAPGKSPRSRLATAVLAGALACWAASGCGTHDEGDILDSSLETVTHDSSSSSAATGTVKEIEIDVDGVTRSFYIFLPDAYLDSADPTRKWPLIVALHSEGEFDGSGMIRETGITQLAEAQGYLIAFPDTVDDLGVQAAIDANVAFIGAVISYAAERGADTEKTYLLGYGVGGVTAQAYLCQMSGRFSAAALISGTLAKTLSQDCPLERAPSILAIHGTADTTSFYGGVEDFGGTGVSLLSFDQTIDFWAEKAGCGNTAELSFLPDTDADDGTISTRKTYSGCTDGRSVEAIAVQNGTHLFPGGIYPSGEVVARDFNAGAMALDFFSRSD